ncbi:I78 family peptidase inhibitor [Yoonia sp.]|uniref:I78 family peptidase inhibitor n=1 Tax=Yoonia sp. TaxID=2212373 RepID=UPI003976028A
MRRIYALIALAGCAVTEPPLPPHIEDTCGAAEFADLIGQKATALETTLLLGPVRIIRPGDAVTMDFQPNRINFIIDVNETIRMIDCG